MQFVLTSATLGDEENATEKVAQFATDLTGVTFYEDDVLQGETIDSFKSELKEDISLEKLGEIIEESGGINGWNEVLFNAEELWKKIISAGLTIARPEEFTTRKILYDLLSEYGLLAKIHDFCRRRPATNAEICKELQVGDNSVVRTSITWLVTMGAHARKTPDSAPLLPMRLHFFARGLAGATVCLNSKCPDHQGTQNWSQFFLEDCNSCPTCEQKVLPISTCVHCGLPVHKIFIENGKWKKMSNPFADDPSAKFLTWFSDWDDDDFLEDGKEGEEAIDESAGQFAYLCTSCGSYSESERQEPCCETSTVHRLRIINEYIAGEHLKKCPRCSGSSGGFDSVLRNFVTAEDAPTAVLAEGIVRNLPIDNKDDTRSVLPANGRNLLVFSDSRQRAAFFSPYLTQTTAESAYLGPLLAAITKIEKSEGEPIDFVGIADQYVRDIGSFPVAVLKSKEDGEEYYKIIPRREVRSNHKREIKKEVELALYKNFCSSKKQKKNLEGVGLATILVDFNESDEEIFTKKVPELFKDNKKFGKQVILSLLQLFLDRKAVEFPDHITARDISRLSVGPDAFTFHRSLSGKIDKRLRYRWNPYNAPTSSQKNAVRTSRQLSILAKVLKKDKNSDQVYLSALLDNIWDCLIEGLLAKTQWPGEFRLNPDCLQVSQNNIQWRFCDQCGVINSLDEIYSCLNGDCPVHRGR